LVLLSVPSFTRFAVVANLAPSSWLLASSNPLIATANFGFTSAI
jgi:hypothetical protein